MLRLPDFSVTRTTIQYDERPPKEDTWKIVTSDQSLHAIETSNTTVLYSRIVWTFSIPDLS